MNTAALTKRQKEIVRVIADYWMKNLSSPSYRDIMAAMGIKSPNGIVCHITALEKKGVIKGKHVRGSAGSQKRSLTVVGMSVTMPDWLSEL